MSIRVKRNDGNVRGLLKGCALGACLGLAIPAEAETLYTKSASGTVSLNRGLTRRECEAAMVRSLPPILYDSKKCDGRGSYACWTSSTITLVNPSTIVEAECLR